MNIQTVEHETIRTGNREDVEYDAFLVRIRERFTENVDDGKRPVFTTDAPDLFTVYLDALPQEDRQYHTCHACRTFIERFGALVVIAEDGATSPAIWNEEDAPALYRPAVAAMAKAVRRAKVTGVFLSSERVWGTPVTGPWRHPAMVPSASMVFSRITQTAGQAMAEKREDFKNVMAALGDFGLPVLEQALSLLRTDALYRSEKVLGPAQWLRDLHVARNGAAGNRRANVVWRAIGTAPAGFCHPRSSMIGTLLEDIASGMDFSEASRRFASKMHPLQYQRPQAAPSAGNIAAAEKIIAQMQAAGSLDRRFARIDEIEAIWRPTVQSDPPVIGGVFGHLKPKGSEGSVPNMNVPPITLTWEKFKRTVLQECKQVEFMPGSIAANYGAILTAVNPDAPPILQWDTDEKRNPFSSYVYMRGSTPAQWSLSAGQWTRVTAIALQTWMWFEGRFPHQGEGSILILEGAKDSRESGNALFPEILKSEFHGIRSTIEAYSRTAKIAGREESSACGLVLGKQERINAHLRVEVGTGIRHEYIIDRWD